MVLVARGHYTVDVLIAYYVTTRLFWIYHTLANSAALKVSHAREETRETSGETTHAEQCSKSVPFICALDN